MLDLLGFWGNVTVLTGVLLIPTIWLTQGIIFHYITKITGSTDKAKAVTRKIWDWNLNSKGVHEMTRYTHMENEEATGNHMRIMGRWLINEGWMALFVISTIIMWVITCAVIINTDSSLVEVVALMSKGPSEFTGIAFALFIAYQGSIYVGKKCYHLIQRVEKVVGTLNETKD